MGSLGSAVSRRRWVGASLQRDEQRSKYVKSSSATAQIPTGAARGGGPFRGADRALEGADKPGQTDWSCRIIASADICSKVIKRGSDFSDDAIIFLTDFGL